MRILFFFLCITRLFSAEITEIVKNLPQEVKKTMQVWKIPGMAVGVVHKGKVVFSQSNGVKSVESKEKVDPLTLFRIASGTKTFTAVLLLEMEKRGLLSLNDKVVKYVPELLFSDASTTKNLTILDILTQRTGLNPFSLDTLWVHDFSIPEIIKSFQFLPQAKPVGEYSYQNITFGLLGIIIERAGKKPYHCLLKEMIFDQLNMNNTTADPTRVPIFNFFINCKNRLLAFIKNQAWFDNIAKPHTLDKGGQPFELNFFTPLYTFPSTSGALTCLEDATKWLQFIMNPFQLFSRTQQDVFVREYVKIPLKTDSSQYPHERFISGHYGLGCFIYQYGTSERSTKVYVELGAYAGNMFFMIWVPEYDVGVVTMSNLGGLRSHFGNQTFCYKFLDNLLGISREQWDAIIKKRMVDFRNKNQLFVKHEKLRQPKAARELKEYTGIYTHRMYGDVEFKEENNQLVMSYRGRKIPLKHWNKDRFNYDPMMMSESYCVSDSAFIEWYFSHSGKHFCYIHQLSEPILPDDNRYFKKK